MEEKMKRLQKWSREDVIGFLARSEESFLGGSKGFFLEDSSE
jgi:hypothetical protein